MIRTHKEKSTGFTLLELMVVVTIIGILAAIAVPGYSKYIRKSKTVEATLNIRKIYDGEIAYYYEELAQRSGRIITKQYITADPQPSTVPQTKTRGNFESAAWGSLKFGTDSAGLYRYTAVASGTGTSSSFTARAEGDLDADGTTSLFERTGSIGTNGEPSGGAGLYSDRELE